MLKRLSNFSSKQIVDAINEIFSDYEYKVNWKVEKFQKDIEEFSIDLDFSMAFCEGDRILALSLTCIRGSRARMDSFGVVPSERGKGLATFLLDEQIKILKDAEIKEYELEVLKSNKKAVNFYEKSGFKKVSSLISLYSLFPPRKFANKFDSDFSHAINLSKKYFNERDLCWLREPESLEKSEKYSVLTSDDFYIFYFTDSNQCFVVDAYGQDLKNNLYSFFSLIDANIFSIVSLSTKDNLYKFLSNNNFMEFSEQWKMKIYL